MVLVPIGHSKMLEHKRKCLRDLVQHLLPSHQAHTVSVIASPDLDFFNKQINGQYVDTAILAFGELH